MSNITHASYSGNSFDFEGRAPGSAGFCFNNDGKKLFIVGYTNDKVYEFDLLCPFNIIMNKRCHI